MPIVPEYLGAMKRLLAIPLILLALPAAAEIYRYVDENGTVVFTDQRPSDDAQPLDLPALTIMDAPKPAAKRPDGEGGEEDSEPAPVYPDLTLLAPKREETFQGTGNTVPVRLASRQALRSSDQVVIFIDGQEQGRFSSMSVDLQQVPRGTHQLLAEIHDGEGRVVGDAGPITFHMKQHSRLHQNQPLVNPPPG